MLDDKKYIPIQYIFIINNGKLYKVGNEPDLNEFDGMAISDVRQVGAVLNVKYTTKWWEEKPQNQPDE